MAILANPAVAQNKLIKIGVITTLSGPTAAMGNDLRNSFEIALDHLGRKMGGIPVQVIYEDDQQKLEISKQKTDSLIEASKVDFIVGYIWSNVLFLSRERSRERSRRRRGGDFAMTVAAARAASTAPPLTMTFMCPVERLRSARHNVHQRLTGSTTICAT